MQMLVSAGMPNLKDKSKLQWVIDALHLEGNDTEAAEKVNLKKYDF